MTCGTAVAHFQRSYPSISEEGYAGDLIFGVLFGLALGPLGVLISAVFSHFYKHGWTLLPRGAE